ncbi:MAG: hypothetical protein ACK4JD_12585 [Thermoflexales bacterium]
MPLPAALLAAASRVAAIAATGARAAAVGGARLGSQIARVGRTLVSASTQAARASVRALSRAAVKLANRARVLGGQLWRALLRALRRIRSAYARFVRAARRLLGDPSTAVGDDQIAAAAKRHAAAKDAIEAMSEALQDDRLLNRLLKAMEAEEGEPDELALRALSEEYQAVVSGLIEEFAGVEDVEVALEAFYERAAPYILAARLAAGADPTVLDDIDVEEHLAQAGEDFVEALSKDPTARATAQASQRLMTAVGESYARARQRLAMARNLTAVAGVDEPTMFADAQSVAREKAKEAEELAQEYGEAKRGLYGLDRLLRRIGQFICSAFGREQPPEARREDETEGREEEAEEPQDEETIYGVWVTDCRRMVSRHCPDCVALEAATAIEPTPVENLPVPGVETQCGALCACCVREMSRDEAQMYGVAYWATSPYLASDASGSFDAIVAMTRERLASDPESLLQGMPERMRNRVREWLSRLRDPDAPLPHSDE